jgi:hypothetical protein
MFCVNVLYTVLQCVCVFFKRAETCDSIICSNFMQNVTVSAFFCHLCRSQKLVVLNQSINY